MSLSEKQKKIAVLDLSVISIGACVAIPNEKKKKPCVVIAYMTEENGSVSFVMADLLPKKALHTPETLLTAIMRAEGVKHVTYNDPEGRPKNICFCRPAAGIVTDILDRDYVDGHYQNGITEIYEGLIKFRIDNPELLVTKHGKKINLTITGATECFYEPDSYEYAIVNAYNACLLGSILEREELRLETREKERIRLEFRVGSSAYVDDHVLYINPVLADGTGLVEYYTTEEFQYIDGDDLSCRAYKIKFSNRFNMYNVTRI